MKKGMILTTTLILALLFFAGSALSFKFPNFGFKGSDMPLLMPVEGIGAIPLKYIHDGKAHHYQVKASDDIVVTFFVLKSQDGVIRAAIDACDVCYRSGKGYKQDGNDMVCQNCGQHFSSAKINVIKGGCNPAPLERKIEGQNLVIAMNDINKNSGYCEFKKQ